MTDLSFLIRSQFIMGRDETLGLVFIEISTARSSLSLFGMF